LVDVDRDTEPISFWLVFLRDNKRRQAKGEGEMGWSFRQGNQGRERTEKHSAADKAKIRAKKLSTNNYEDSLYFGQRGGMIWTRIDPWKSA
jgi:hypothetical protein